MKDALVFWTVVSGFLVASCTSILPMTGEMNLPESDVQRIAEITKLTPEQVRDKTIHETHEVKLSFVDLMGECYPSVKWYLKLLGSVPLACTKIIQQPWNEKVALIYYWALTDPITMNHEREHAKGAAHLAW